MSEVITWFGARPAEALSVVAFVPVVGERLNYEAGRRFIESIPKGRWAGYADVAVAAGSVPRGAIGVGSWLRGPEGSEIPTVYRVLTSGGEVSPRWRSRSDALPSSPASVRAALAAEGVKFDSRGRAVQAQRWRVEDWRRKAGLARQAR